MSEPLRALTLISCVNGKLVLHEDVGKKVFESDEARNRPVAVISIAGVLRKGKSFFLNFVLRYLKSKDVKKIHEVDPETYLESKKDKNIQDERFTVFIETLSFYAQRYLPLPKSYCNWIWSGSNKLDGFEWKPNIDGVTSGITIWPEVFVVNDVAVVLIDTQGLYELGKETPEDTFIMVLSSLFSSVQILNYQENLNALDLKSFEFFAKYGLELEKITKNEKGFQNLMFLIRDWKHETKYPYGLKGGNEYLQKDFKDKTSKELKSVCDVLKHFKKDECFLMPHPGEMVTQNANFKGDIKAVKYTFLENMKKLVEYLIVTLKPKEVVGREANGEYLLQVIKNYVECLNEGKLPAPQSLIQMQEELSRKESKRKCLMKYNFNMNQGTKDKLLSEAEMNELHKKCSAAAIAVVSTTPFTSEEQKQTLESNLLKKIESSYTRCKSTMKINVEKELKNYFEQSKNTYLNNLKKISERSENIEILKDRAQNCKKITVADFKSGTKFGETESTEKLLKSFEEFMDEEYNKCEDNLRINPTSRAGRSIAKASDFTMAAAGIVGTASVGVGSGLETAGEEIGKFDKPMLITGATAGGIAVAVGLSALAAPVVLPAAIVAGGVAAGAVAVVAVGKTALVAGKAVKNAGNLILNSSSTWFKSLF